MKAPPRCHDYGSLACKDAYGFLRFLEVDGPYKDSDWMILSADDDNYVHVRHLRKTLAHITPQGKSARTHPLIFGPYGCGGRPVVDGVSPDGVCPHPDGTSHKSVVGFCGGPTLFLSRNYVEQLVLALAGVKSLQQLDEAAKTRYLDIYTADTKTPPDVLLGCFNEYWLGNIDVNPGLRQIF